jgi:hypothetical protein
MPVRRSLECQPRMAGYVIWQLPYVPGEKEIKKKHYAAVCYQSCSKPDKAPATIVLKKKRQYVRPPSRVCTVPFTPVPVSCQLGRAWKKGLLLVRARQAGPGLE